MNYLKLMTGSGVISNPSDPDSAAHAVESQERRNEEQEKKKKKADKDIHTLVLAEFKNDDKYLSNCLSTLGASLDINQLEKLYRTGDMRAIKTMLLDALINELTMGVK